MRGAALAMQQCDVKQYADDTTILYSTSDDPVKQVRNKCFAGLANYKEIKRCPTEQEQGADLQRTLCRLLLGAVAGMHKGAPAEH